MVCQGGRDRPSVAMSPQITPNERTFTGGVDVKLGASCCARSSSSITRSLVRPAKMCHRGRVDYSAVVMMKLLLRVAGVVRRHGPGAQARRLGLVAD